jgi:hypothetical protein
VLGLGMILVSYWLIYSARGRWDYDGIMTGLNYSRYHLVPQLGLTLFVVGGLPGRLFPEAAWTRRQVVLIGGLLLACLLIQLPRGLVGSGPPEFHHRQAVLLGRIDAMDDRCRSHHLSAAQARAVLPALPLSEWSSQVNGWELLRGSDSPEPRSVEEARRLLRED